MVQKTMYVQAHVRTSHSNVWHDVVHTCWTACQRIDSGRQVKAAWRIGAHLAGRDIDILDDDGAVATRGLHDALCDATQDNT